MTEDTPMTTEAEARQLRDQIYGPGNPEEWEKCKHNWMQPEALLWLRREAIRIREHRQGLHD